jgi:NADPH:quinone reductase-like Zn-dependent oxidoreductase
MGVFRSLACWPEVKFRSRWRTVAEISRHSGIGVGHRRALEDFVRAVDVTGLKPVIEHRYRFNELEQALEHLDRGAFGKIVLTRE